MTNYIAYYRVSTKKQGNSGLGIEAQKTTVRQFIKDNGNLLDEYVEVESGKKDNRAELNKAINKCKETGSTLIIAKLDRLSRNYDFIFSLKNSKVKFVCCDLPDANTLTIGIMASLAQYERELISDRIKKALNEKKKQGHKLGSPNNLNDKARQKAHKAKSEKANNNEINKNIFNIAYHMKLTGLGYRKIANYLNNENYKTVNGKSFTPMTVKLILERFSKIKNQEI